MRNIGIAVLADIEGLQQSQFLDVFVDEIGESEKYPLSMGELRL